MRSDLAERAAAASNVSTIAPSSASPSVSTRIRLIEQYQRVAADSGRFERNERVRFLNHLLDTLREHHSLATIGKSSQPCEDWQLAFLCSRAARSGIDASVVFSFLLEEMPGRVGLSELRSNLTGSGCRFGTSLSRRLAAPMAARCAKLAMARVMGVGETEQEYRLAGALFETEEHARIDIAAPANARGDWLRDLKLAVAVDNTANVALFGLGVEVKIQVQTASSGHLSRTGMSSFGLLQQLDPGRRGWVAFRGVSFGTELLREVGTQDPITAIRLLIARK